MYWKDGQQNAFVKRVASELLEPDSPSKRPKAGLSGIDRKKIWSGLIVRAYTDNEAAFNMAKANPPPFEAALPHCTLVTT
jgi:hypothetical protein